jgi:hypothetical protein
MGAIKMHPNFGQKTCRGRDHSEDTGVDRKIILEWILGHSVGKCGLDASGSG